MLKAWICKIFGVTTEYIKHFATIRSADLQVGLQKNDRTSDDWGDIYLPTVEHIHKQILKKYHCLMLKGWIFFFLNVLNSKHVNLKP